MDTENVIKEQFEALHVDLNVLDQLLRNSPLRLARVTPIPGVPPGQENEPIHGINVTEHTGADAVKLAIACYKDLYISSNYSQKSARRTPGVLWYSPTRSRTAEKIEDVVERINAAKETIEKFIVSTYPTRQGRFEALRAECPGVMTLHLYRKIRCYASENVRSVRFSWLQKDVLTKPAKTEMVARIEEDMQYGGADRNVALQQLLTKVMGTPADQLRVRRGVKVQPAANIMLSTGVKTVTAPMPIIIVQNEQLETGVLSNFELHEHRKTRSDKVKSQILGTYGGNVVEAFEA